MSLPGWLTGLPNIKRLKAKRNVSGLIKALNYRRPFRSNGQVVSTGVGVRASAARALGEIGDPQAVNPLIALLTADSDEALIRHNVAWALGQLRDRRGIEYLIPLLAEADEHLRMVAAESLGKIGDPEGVEHIIPLLEDENYTVRWYVAWILGETGNPCALGPLLACFAEEPNRGWLLYENAEPEPLNGVFKHTSMALGKIGDARAVEPLMAHLKSNELGARRSAARALGELRDERAVEPLISLLNDSSWSVRLAAAEALGKIGDTRAVDPITGLLNDAKEEVRQTATHAFEVLTD